jgi:hypothetical protein
MKGIGRDTFQWVKSRQLPEGNLNTRPTAQHHICAGQYTQGAIPHLKTGLRQNRHSAGLKVQMEVILQQENLITVAPISSLQK